LHLTTSATLAKDYCQTREPESGLSLNTKSSHKVRGFGARGWRTA